LTAVDIARTHHPSHSPDQRPCDFRLFEFLKESIKSVELSSEDQIIEVSANIWRGASAENRGKVRSVVLDRALPFSLCEMIIFSIHMFKRSVGSPFKKLADEVNSPENIIWNEH
jgi:hypothetical protein